MDGSRWNQQAGMTLIGAFGATAVIVVAAVPAVPWTLGGPSILPGVAAAVLVMMGATRMLFRPPATP